MKEKSNEFESSKEIIEISKAFSESLKMINDVNAQQKQQIICSAVEALRETITLVKEAYSIQLDNPLSDNNEKLLNENLKDLTEKVKSIAGTTEINSIEDKMEVPNSSESEKNYKSAVIEALSMACYNSVYGSQQSNILAQATTSLVITNMNSLVIAVLGVGKGNKG